jgi:hypothetical protein
MCAVTCNDKAMVSESKSFDYAPRHEQPSLAVKAAAVTTTPARARILAFLSSVKRIVSSLYRTSLHNRPTTADYNRAVAELSDLFDTHRDFLEHLCKTGRYGYFETEEHENCFTLLDELALTRRMITELRDERYAADPKKPSDPPYKPRLVNKVDIYAVSDWRKLRVCLSLLSFTRRLVRNLSLGSVSRIARPKRTRPRKSARRSRRTRRSRRSRLSRRSRARY